MDLFLVFFSLNHLLITIIYHVYLQPLLVINVMSVYCDGGGSIHC